MMTDNTHPRLTKDDVTHLEIPLPTLDVQQDVVDEVRRRREEARRLRAEAETEWAAAKERFEKQLLGKKSMLCLEDGKIQRTAILAKYLK